MGSSADAILAWGIDFGDTDDPEEAYNWRDTDYTDFKDTVMPGLLGFTEVPPVRPDGLEGAELTAWFDTYRKPYIERYEAAVPVTFRPYGYRFSGTALVLRRSCSTVECGALAVNPATIEPPSVHEMAALHAVSHHLGWNRPVALLLMALYG